jgi:hypothetical protein
MTLSTIRHLKLTFGGDLGSPAVEQWVCGLKYLPAASPYNYSENQLQTAVDALADTVKTWFQSSGALIGNSAFLNFCKLVSIGTNGKQESTNTPQHDFATPGVGAFTNYKMIWEQSYVLTFRTPLTRGRSHVGRIYPPLSGAGPVGTTPYADGSLNDGMATAGAVLLTDVATSIAATLEPGGPTGGFANISPGDSVKGTSPIATYITGVECDRVADIQHRRTNRVPRVGGTLAVVPQ